MKIRYASRAAQRSCTQKLKQADVRECAAEKEIWDELQKGGPKLMQERLDFARHIEEKGSFAPTPTPPHHHNIPITGNQSI